MSVAFDLGGPWQVEELVLRALGLRVEAPQRPRRFKSAEEPEAITVRFRDRALQTPLLDRAKALTHRARELQESSYDLGPGGWSQGLQNTS